MYPNLEIFGFTISWYSSFHLLGVLIAFIFAFWYYQKNTTLQLNGKQFIGLLITLYITIMLGGRLVSFVETWQKTGIFPHWSMLYQGPSAGQLRWSGSMLLSILLLPIISKKILKIKLTDKLLDLIAMAFCVLTIFTKQGCQFSGDGCYGIVTNLPWGMHYPYGAAPNIFPVHPTPIYDSLFHAIFFIFLFWYDGKRKQQNGQTAFIYFTGASAFYMLLECIRLNPEIGFGITLPQLVYMLIIMCSYYYFSKAQSFKIFHHTKNIEKQAAEPTWF